MSSYAFDDNSLSAVLHQDIRHKLPRRSHSFIDIDFAVQTSTQITSNINVTDNMSIISTQNQFNYEMEFSQDQQIFVTPESVTSPIQSNVEETEIALISSSPEEVEPVHVSKIPDESIPATQCVICFDDLPNQTDNHSSTLSTDFCCAVPSHRYCSSCFLDYILHCCSEYANNSFPIKCGYNQCKQIIPESFIKQFLIQQQTLKDQDEQKHTIDDSKDNSTGTTNTITTSITSTTTITTTVSTTLTYLSRYESACLKSGLIHSIQLRSEVEFSCSHCQKFSILLPQDYKHRAAQLRKLKADEKKQEEEEEERKKKTHMTAEQLKLQAEEEKKKKSAKKYLKNIFKSSPKNIQVELSTAHRSSHQPTENVDPTEQEDFTCFTSEFFECENDDCCATICLICDKVMLQGEKESMLNHECDLLQVDSKYEEVCELLAEAAGVKCPGCGTRTTKDLACCHMRCPTVGCGIQYCYCCGEEQKNGWVFHNQWNLSHTVSPPDPPTCPMYLNYWFGGGAIHPTYLYYFDLFTEEQSGRCLQLFHIRKQRIALNQAISKWSEEEKTVYDQMVKIKFPNGVFDSKDLEHLHKIEKDAWETVVSNDEKLKNGPGSVFRQAQALNVDVELAALRRMNEAAANRPAARAQAMPYRNPNRARNNQCCIIC